jgi:hypothetical protein
MILDDAKGKLSYAARKLRLHWEEAQQRWNDSVSRDFDRHYLSPFEPQVAATLQAMTRLAEVLDEVERDCS